jgi:hypothetical protein
MIDGIVNVYYVVRQWFSKSWWNYLFDMKSSDVSWFTVILCRIKGHPAGTVFYNTNGLEPDMHCKNCGDNLG